MVKGMVVELQILLLQMREVVAARIKNQEWTKIYDISMYVKFYN